MSVRGSRIGVSCDVVTNQGCVDVLGCPSNRCPDFILKRHDTKPPFKVVVDDCDGALDLTDETLVLEVNMWAKGKLKKAVTADDTYFSLADNIGFEQIMMGDIIVMDRVRRPEQMLVIGFDETNGFIRVQRAYGGTQASAWKRGTGLKIFRIMGGSAEINLVYEDVLQPDGSTTEDQLVESQLVYEWQANDTCLPGCFWLEFKLLKMSENDVSSQSVIPSFTPSTLTPEDFGCGLGDGVEWSRRFPTSDEGFLIKIEDSPTTEM